jgi:hypothetical protein
MRQAFLANTSLTAGELDKLAAGERRRGGINHQLGGLREVLGRLCRVLLNLPYFSASKRKSHYVGISILQSASTTWPSPTPRRFLIVVSASSAVAVATTKYRRTPSSGVTLTNHPLVSGSGRPIRPNMRSRAEAASSKSGLPGARLNRSRKMLATRFVIRISYTTPTASLP